MKLRMAENSLFAILLRSPWWASAGLAVAVFTAARLLLPDAYAPSYAPFIALPFVVIGIVTAWRQLRAPSAARVARVIEALRVMSWDEFAAAVESAFAAQGYAVARIEGAGAEFELTRAGRVALLGCRRWKAARTGIEPLRELLAAREARDAHECFYLATGAFTDTAQAFATKEKIRLLRDAELAKLMPRLAQRRKS